MSLSLIWYVSHFPLPNPVLCSAEKGFKYKPSPSCLKPRSSGGLRRGPCCLLLRRDGRHQLFPGFCFQPHKPACRCPTLRSAPGKGAALWVGMRLTVPAWCWEPALCHPRISMPPLHTERQPLAPTASQRSSLPGLLSICPVPTPSSGPSLMNQTFLPTWG